MVISANVPNGKEGVSYVAKYDEFASQGTSLGYKVAPWQPSDTFSLERAIRTALLNNKGVPFRRILVISHAGGPVNGPSLNLNSERGRWNRITNGNIHGDLTSAVRAALGPNGIFVLGSCGYYYKEDEVYRARWLTNLRRIAEDLGVTVFASPGLASPNLLTGIDTWKTSVDGAQPLDRLHAGRDKAYYPPTALNQAAQLSRSADRLFPRSADANLFESER